MKVSIITTVWNNEAYIEDAILSVLSQTYNNIEYIVIDGGSTDGTISIIDKYKNNISFFISEPDKGIYDGLNKGISLATGDIIGFLHSDDIYEDINVISNIVDKFSLEHVDGVYSDLVYTQKEDMSRIIRYWKSRQFNSRLLKHGWMPPHPTLFLKKSIYNKFGIFNLDYSISADYDFMLRIFASDIKVYYFPNVTYKMRIGGKSNQSFKHIIQKSKEDLLALRNNNIGGIFSLIKKNISKVYQFF